MSDLNTLSTYHEQRLLSFLSYIHITIFWQFCDSRQYDVICTCHFRVYRSLHNATISDSWQKYQKSAKYFYAVYSYILYVCMYVGARYRIIASLLALALTSAVHFALKCDIEKIPHDKIFNLRHFPCTFIQVHTYTYIYITVCKNTYVCLHVCM